jgi:cytochrome c-type biogenesis protein CcmE
LIISLFLASTIILFIFNSLKDNIVYFYSPTEIYEKNSILEKEKIRVGGLVKKKSLTKNNDTINFIITDLKNEIIVNYKGLIPNLFSEGKGVIAEGFLKDKKFFVADKILAKHDENYMPPEVSSILEKNN